MEEEEDRQIEKEEARKADRRRKKIYKHVKGINLGSQKENE